MLMPRQAEIVLYLLNRGDWCGGEELCAEFRVTKNTLLQELRRIQEELRDGLVIETGRQGYRLAALTGSARAEVQAQLETFWENKSIAVRPAAILLYLMHLREPVTIRELSRVFYLSKSGVDRELRTIRRWLDDFEGLTLDISGNQGMRVIGSEKRKRICCARIGSRTAIRSTPLGEELAARYAAVRERVGGILGECLHRHGLLISGTDYRLIVRFITAAVVRSGLGFPREREPGGGEALPPAVLDIADALAAALGVSLTETERWDLWEVIEQSSIIAGPAGDGQSDAEGALREKLDAMDALIRGIVALPEDFRFEGRESLLPYLDKVNRRYANGNLHVNHHDASILLEYPLEVHLATRMYPAVFGGQATEETSGLALFLGSNLRMYQNRLSVLLVTNEHQGVIYQLANLLRQFGYPRVDRVDALPEYVYRHDRSVGAGYDVKLTTEPGVRLEEPDFYFVSAVLSPEDVHRLEAYFRRRDQDKRRERLARVAAEMPLRAVEAAEKPRDLDALVGPPGDAGQTCHLVRDRALFVCRVGPEVRQEVTLYTLRKPLVYRRTSVSRVLFAACRARDELLTDRFIYISGLLKEL